MAFGNAKGVLIVGEIPLTHCTYIVMGIYTHKCGVVYETSESGRRGKLHPLPQTQLSKELVQTHIHTKSILTVYEWVGDELQLSNLY